VPAARAEDRFTCKRETLDRLRLVYSCATTLLPRTSPLLHTGGRGAPAGLRREIVSSAHDYGGRGVRVLLLLRRHPLRRPSHSGERIGKDPPLHSLGTNLLLVGYRGHGSSSDRIFLGRSLGTGPATEMAKEHPDASGLIRISPFTSTVDTAKTIIQTIK
jgi:hypothetical protein